jgi:alpha-glucosidase
MPFYYGLNQGVAYGIFFDNTFPTHFDFNSQDDNITAFWAEGGELNYYFLHGPSLLMWPEPTPGLPASTNCRQYGRWGFTNAAGVTTRTAGCGKLPTPSAPSKFPATPSTSTLTTWTATAVSPGIASIFPTQGPDSRTARNGFQTVVMIDPGYQGRPGVCRVPTRPGAKQVCAHADGDGRQRPRVAGLLRLSRLYRPEVREWWGELYAELCIRKPVSRILERHERAGGVSRPS